MVPRAASPGLGKLPPAGVSSKGGKEEGASLRPSPTPVYSGLCEHSGRVGYMASTQRAACRAGSAGTSFYLALSASRRSARTPGSRAGSTCSAVSGGAARSLLRP